MKLGVLLRRRPYALTIHPRWHARAVAYDSFRTGHSLRMAASKPTAYLHADLSLVATLADLSVAILGFEPRLKEV